MLAELASVCGIPAGLGSSTLTSYVKKGSAPAIVEPVLIGPIFQVSVLVLAS